MRLRASTYNRHLVALLQLVSHPRFLFLSSLLSTVPNMARTEQKARMCTGGKAKRVVLRQPRATAGAGVPPPAADVQMNEVPTSNENVRTYYVM